MSFSDGLLNSVVIEHRSITSNATGEEEEVYTDGATIPASVQDRTPSELAIPDVDGPLVINAVVFTNYRTDIRHLDRLRQVDVTPARTYVVVDPKDPAGRHHHLEVDATRLETVAGAGS